MNISLMRLGIISSSLVVCTTIGFSSRSMAQTDPPAPMLPQKSAGLWGYISMQVPPPPEGFGYGVSFYVTAWPLTEKPLRHFQIGLPSTWIIPDNREFELPLCPHGTPARDHWDERGPSYRSVFQTIEGGLGFWGSTQFSSTTAKFRMNGTSTCYRHEISSPGWGFGRTTPLTDEEVGLIQLSNRLLVPPDGLTFKTGTNGEIFGYAWAALPLTELKGHWRIQPEFKPEIWLHDNALVNESIEEAPMWRLHAVSAGVYQLESRSTESKAGKFLTASASSVTLTNRTTELKQQWKLEQVDHDLFFISSVSDPALSLMVDGNDQLVLRAPRGLAVTDERPDVQAWQLHGAVLDSEPSTGNQSWTMFLNAANFSGAVAYFAPETWSAIAQEHAIAAGRGLDFRPGVMSGGAIEINTVPRFEAEDAAGNRYLKLPKIQFPVNDDLQSPLMQDVHYIGRNAAFVPVRQWIEGGMAFTGEINPDYLYQPDCRAQPLRLAQGNPRVSMEGVNKFVDTVSLGKNSYGLQWQAEPTNEMATLPQYYRQDKDAQTLVVIDEAEVPVELGLQAASFLTGQMRGPYFSPEEKSSAWRTPGPVRKAEIVELADGSSVKYMWYRFIDQPAIVSLGLSEAERARLQALVENIHRNWRADGAYLPPPSQGLLATLDPALLLEPPESISVGYVPIVVRQFTTTGGIPKRP